eukprot:CAMPEP_0116824424 /NCGR_PEP_ID=MMETSP0418-20121206/1390_1 /TAXON_ID=1158023 /ORGANISM="Astrosyne radiata, Strain 13vi08-1A" /LENGTH=87 /DNA_ID=CAMNT_0004452795 /DNA_START=127 /DNA_END=390 /DNA_ORIENTATION=-
MPPRRARLPHGLTKDPTQMSWAEWSVFGVLVGSVGIGLFQMVTSPWGEASTHPVEGEKKAGTRRTDLLRPNVEDGITKVSFESSPKK